MHRANGDKRMNVRIESFIQQEITGMALWGREDEYRIPGDMPGTRYALLQTATMGNIVFMCILTLICAALSLAGMIGLLYGSDGGPKLENVPEPIGLLAIGMSGFCLFLPLLLALYFGRHFLRSLMRLEDEVARLKATIEDNRTPKP
jgi:hypothetical protein